MAGIRSLSRRAALAGSASVLAPAIVRAQTTELPKPESVSMVMPGNVTWRARFFKPANTPAPAVVVVPDGWGLTPDFEALGANLAFEGMLGLVIDMNAGKLAETQVEADQLAKKADGEQPGEVVSAWHDWLRNRLECDRRTTAFGFGPGGRWAVAGTMWKSAAGVAVWSTRIENNPKDLHSIYEFFVAHFSDRDTTPGQVMVADLAQRLKAAQRDAHLFRYNSRPLFYNPRSPDYDKPDASLAWRRTMALYKKLYNLSPAR
jgi:carboxymethylenebutenolidase